MKYLLSLFGIAASILMIIYREKISQVVGDQEWMSRFGGIYNVIILVAIFIFFWSIAELTGTRNLFLSPLIYLIPGAQRGPPPEVF